MKNIILVLITTLLFIGCKNDKNTVSDKKHDHNNIPKVKVKTSNAKVLSPHTSAMSMIGDAHIHIDYSSPGVRNRIVFGGLLAYDEVWQAGAHMATWLETNKDLTIANNNLPAGKYGFFMIPSQNEWTVIFNRNWDQHGKDEYDEKDDVVRIKVKPINLDSIIEHLEYKVNKINETTGTISLSWERVSIRFPFQVND